jgi:hypothetical protein
MLNRDIIAVDVNHIPVENAERGDMFIPLDEHWRFFASRGHHLSGDVAILVAVVLY